MPQKPVLLQFDKPHFQVKLHSDLLQVDLKEGARKELERLAEARPILRDSLGWILQTIIPLDVKLYEIEKVESDGQGQVHLRIPARRDVSIPLEPAESRRLVEKLNELIPVEKQRAFERAQAEREAEKAREKAVTEDLKYVRKWP